LQQFWTAQPAVNVAEGLSAVTLFGLVAAICVAQTGSLFSADAWHNVTIVAGEVREPRRNLPLALILGVGLVIGLYLLANLAYLATLPLSAIQQAPGDRVATAMLERIFPGVGVTAMAAAIMVSTFGCNNGLILAGARASYALARDGLFFPQASRLNAARVPAWGLALQGIWASVLVLARTKRGDSYGNLYGDLLDYVISAALLFYILTIAGLFRLRRLRPEAPRPYRAWGYPWLPGLYMVGAGLILVVLFAYRPATTWPGLGIVLIGLPVYWACRGRRRGRAVASILDSPR
jgi:APA family basic amino acid/polyamine antiporter